jgi:colanic acid/amylovoran biosynthesis glycosyltransferase
LQEHKYVGRPQELLLVSAEPLYRPKPGVIRLSQKFLSGVLKYQTQWSGKINVLAEESTYEGKNLDYADYLETELPFELSLKQFKRDQLSEIVKCADMVLIMLYHRQFVIAEMCLELNVPFVAITEYSLRTRYQIILLEKHNVLKRTAKLIIETWREYLVRKYIRAAAGVQSNGTPTFDIYSKLNSNTILFFDNRVSSFQLAEESEISHRNIAARTSKTLAFSGRLIAMKGAGHLIEVAKHLNDRAQEFTLHIFGDGDLRNELQLKVYDLHLSDRVFIHGSVNFERELLPWLKKEVDVFICCHPQGDPSCTYLETLSCGVPIAGYDNEAFSGIARVSGVGWSVQSDPLALAQKIIELSFEEIEEQAFRSLSFARQHTFEKEFEKRMDHIKQAAERAPVTFVA